MANLSRAMREGALTQPCALLPWLARVQELRLNRHHLPVLVEGQRFEGLVEEDRPSPASGPVTWWRSISATPLACPNW
jgi:hypothetical protein